MTEGLPAEIPATAVVQGDQPGLYIWVADSNIPNPKKTTRIVHEDVFYSKWYEKWPNYLVRRPAMAVEREITSGGRQVMASEKTAAKNKTVDVQEKKDPNAPLKGKPLKHRSDPARDLAEGKVNIRPGPHVNKPQRGTGTKGKGKTQRHPKHKQDLRQQRASELVARFIGEKTEDASSPSAALIVARHAHRSRATHWHYYFTLLGQGTKDPWTIQKELKRVLPGIGITDFEIHEEDSTRQEDESGKDISIRAAGRSYTMTAKDAAKWVRKITGLHGEDEAEQLSDSERSALLEYIVHTRQRTPHNDYTKAAHAELSAAQMILLKAGRKRRAQTLAQRYLSKQAGSTRMKGGARREVMQQVFDMYAKTYASIGMHLKSPEALLKYDVWDVGFDDGVPVFFSLYETTSFGLKAGLSGFDGSSAGKSMAVSDLRSKYKKSGVYGEVSHKVKSIALGAGSPAVCAVHAQDIWNAMGKTISYTDDPITYDRSLKGVGRVRKTMIGNPKGTPTTDGKNPSCPLEPSRVTATKVSAVREATEDEELFDACSHASDEAMCALLE